MTTTLPPDHDRAPSERTGRRRPVVAALALTVLVLGVVVGLLVLTPAATPGGGSPTALPTSAPAATTSPSSSQPTPTAGTVTTTPTPTTVTPSVPADAVTAVWPTGAVPTRYTDPVAAARGFAVDMAAFADPVLGAFRTGDSRSGEVEVRPAPDGPVTTVFVRLLGDGTWWVLGAATADVTLDTPAAGDLIAGTAELSGTALAFEGTVDVRILDDTTATLATSVVTGGGDVPRPFRGVFPLDGPAAPHGTVLLTTASAADGSTWTASAVRVGLAP
ncbi:Gmad2 immunoglobulin-like domain-containing protein [Pseudonocardia hydrocarbonoxydans]|uniref:Gmad2 immunoglobulin-like domain-containing protein n=1 Tax=Pseudonocardia hydrocarbonoxydans TaxID=76726 RepID=UPI0031D1298B